MNAVLQDLPALGASAFLCREPRWLSAIKRGLLLLSACGFMYVTLSVPALSTPLTLLLWAAAATMLAIVLRSESAPVLYACDANGLYFPSGRRFRIPVAAARTWLFVPWCNVSSMSVQPLVDEFGRADGVVFCLRASEEERQAYFSTAPRLAPNTRTFPGDANLVAAGFRSNFTSPYKVAAVLRALWRPQRVDS